MTKNQFTTIVLMCLFFITGGTAWVSDPVMKKPVRILPDQIPTIISSQKILKSSYRLLQSPGTVLDSTYYDWQRNGGLDDHIAMFDDFGTVKINATMMSSWLEDTSDRHMHYYYHDGAGWNTGIADLSVFNARDGFGSMSQMSSGTVVITSHTDNGDGLGTRAYVAYDAFPGIRAFSYTPTDEVTRLTWPHVSVNEDSSISLLAEDGTDVFWARTPEQYSPFTEWTNFRDLAPDWMDDDMEWPTIHSGTNGKVGVVIPDLAGSVRLFESNNNGVSWAATTIAPADTGGAPIGLDSTAARLGWINSDIMYIGDEPHVAWTAAQIASDGAGGYGLFDFKATIFHWSPSTGIDEVVVATTQSADDTRADYVPTPFNHMSVDWPSIGIATDGSTIVIAFTAFAIGDVDPTSLPPFGFVDIWVATSVDNGNTWSAPTNVTNPDGTFLGWDDRYPSIAKVNMEIATDPGKDVYLIYQSDDLAGTFVQRTEGAVNMDYIKFLGIDLEISPIIPVANFSADPTSGERPLTVDFADLSIGQIIDWVWDFGDGDSSFVQHPTHVYNDTGLFTVSLGIRGPGGVDDTTMVDLIHVIEPPVIYLTVTPDTTAFPRGGEVGFTVAVTNNTSETVLVDGWTDATLPSGRYISPEVGPVEFYLGPWHTLNMYVTRPIPPLAPLGGPYTLCVLVGDYPDPVYAEDCFEFDVVPGVD